MSEQGLSDEEFIEWVRQSRVTSDEIKMYWPERLELWNKVRNKKLIEEEMRWKAAIAEKQKDWPPDWCDIQAGRIKLGDRPFNIWAAINRNGYIVAYGGSEEEASEAAAEIYVGGKPSDYNAVKLECRIAKEEPCS